MVSGRFSWSKVGFHDSRSVFMVFPGSRLIFPGYRLIFHVSRLVFHGSRLVFMGFFMIAG